MEENINIKTGYADKELQEVFEPRFICWLYIHRWLRLLVGAVPILLGGMVLSSCATTQKYEALLQTWIGHDEEELVSKWGPPDSVYVVSNTKKMLTYSKGSNMILPGSAPHYSTTYIGNTAYTTSYGGSAPISVNLSCKTSFTVEKGQIIHWRWEGNNCVSD